MFFSSGVLACSLFIFSVCPLAAWWYNLDDCSIYCISFQPIRRWRVILLGTSVNSISAEIATVLYVDTVPAWRFSYFLDIQRNKQIYPGLWYLFPALQMWIFDGFLGFCFPEFWTFGCVTLGSVKLETDFYVLFWHFIDQSIIKESGRVKKSIGMVHVSRCMIILNLHVDAVHSSTHDS